MFTPFAVSADQLTIVNVNTIIYDNGRHYDVGVQIDNGVNIGGFLDVSIEGDCQMYIFTYEQFLPYNETTISPPAVGTYSYMAEAYYIDGPTYWNYTIAWDTQEWFFVFYKYGGSGGSMIINASIWDWSYVETTTTDYPTSTQINPTHNETTTTETYPYSTITTGETILPPFEIDWYVVGMMIIVGIGFMAVIYITGAKSRWRLT